MATPHTQTRRAHAKLNLALSVGPPIPAGQPGAGYHPIASWMHAIDLADEVTARRLPPDERSMARVKWADDARRPSPIDWPIDQDLAFRAHAALEAEAGRRLPVELIVTKRIPVGGGLGGGSCDAAATLLVLNALFELRFPAEQLIRVGASLGSDVPFFIDPQNQTARPALVLGLGERIERLAPVAGAPGEVLLLLPPFGCPTGAVYRAFDSLPGARLREADVRQLAAGGEPDAALFNDLTAAAERVEPRLRELRERAERVSGSPARMTGSGSTLFLTPRTGEGPHLETKLRRELADVTVVRTRLV